MKYKKIQDMVSGKYRERVSIGYEGKTTNQRKEGEEWVDAEVVDGLFKMVRENKSQKYHQEVLTSVMVGKVSDCILKTIDQENI